MSDFEAVHQESAFIREELLERLGEIMTEAEAKGLVAYPEMINKGPTPVLGGLVYDDAPSSYLGYSLNAHIFHEGTPAGPAYTMQINPIGISSFSAGIQVSVSEGFCFTDRGKKVPMQPLGYQALDDTLDATVFTENETLYLVEELRRTGQLAQPSRASLRDQLYVGMMTTYVALYC